MNTIILQKYKYHFLNIKNYIKEIDYYVDKFIFDKFWDVFTNKFDILIDDEIIKWLNYNNEDELLTFLEKNNIIYEKYEYNQLNNIYLLPEDIKEKYIVINLNEFKNLVLLNDNIKNNYENIEKLYNEYSSYKIEFLKLNSQDIIKNNLKKAIKIKKTILVNIYDLLIIIENSINKKNEIIKKKNILLYDKENIISLLEEDEEYELINDINTEIEKRNRLLNELNELIKQKHLLVERNYKSLNDINNIIQSIE